MAALIGSDSGLAINTTIEFINKKIFIIDLYKKDRNVWIVQNDSNCKAFYFCCFPTWTR